MIYGFLEIIGSLGLFLFGMKVMSEGIQKASGDRLHGILNFMTGNRIAAVLTGFAITSIVQSSSATTVMVVSFVNASLLSLVQAIGVIMGANIGTTVTGWIVAILGFKVNIVMVALPMIGIGFPLIMIKKWKREAVGEALIGFGLLFLGLEYLKDSVPDIKNNPEVLEFLKHYTHWGFWSLLLFILVGTLVTIIVQSSSAAMAVTLTMAHAGWIDMPTAAAIVLGENIGTTITAFLASLGTHVNARRAARAHTLFNLIGVFWMLVVFRPFLHLVDIIIPGEMTSLDGVTTHLAMFHTLFNLVNTLILVNFVGSLEKIVTKLVPERPEEETLGTYALKYLSTPMQDTGEINILQAQMELIKMMNILQTMFTRFLDIWGRPTADITDEVAKLENMENYTDQMQEAITQFLIECAQDELNDASATNVNLMIRIANEMESIGDSCFTLGLLCQRRNHKKLTFSPQAVDDLTPYIDLVQRFLAFNKMHLNESLTEAQLEDAYTLENDIDALRKKLKKNAQVRLQEGAEVKGELLYIDILQNIEHIGDYCLNISQALRQYH